MALKRVRRKPMAEINVVPYIDVTLVLLIIFMITTPLLQTGVDVDLPQADSETIEQDKEPPIIISIDADGNYSIDLDGEGLEAIEKEALTTLIKAAVNKKPGKKVYIGGDEKVNYGAVITVMTALQEADVPSVGLMTRPYDQ